MNWKELRTIDSPLMIQYVAFKEKHDTDIVLFQVGEFYEIYAEDAIQASKMLELKQTARNIGGISIPMCGVPAGGAVDQANKLAKLGCSVVLISQSKDDSGQVNRFIDSMVTPGTIMDETYLSSDEHSYIMTVYTMKDDLGVTLLDTLSGEVITQSCHRFMIFDLLTRYRPKETKIYLPKQWDTELMQRLTSYSGVQCIAIPYYYEEMKPAVEEHRGTYFKDVSAPYLVVASHYFMMQYLGKVQSQHVTLRPITYLEQKDYMTLHEGAMTGLDLLENTQTKKKKGSLYDLLDQCVTAKGSRTLKRWIQEPLVKPAAMESRYQSVTTFLEDANLRDELRLMLHESVDLERMLARFESRKFKDAELPLFLQTTILYEQFLKTMAAKSKSTSLRKLGENMAHKLEKLNQKWASKISVEETIAPGYDTAFDRVREMKKNGLKQLQVCVEGERVRSDIRTLKLEENKVLGYFFEVTTSHLSKVPSHFIERQKISSGKRYVTEELKALEAQYYEAQEQYEGMRRACVQQIVMEILQDVHVLRKITDNIGILDVLMSLSVVASEQGYRKPELSDDGSVRIVRGIHPLLQKFSYKKVIPNNCDLGESEIQIVTGPNMGGKSTYLKMVGTMLVMAQLGSFVPAGLVFTPVDRVLLRMGAGDALLSGKSTFAVEMEEVAYISYCATANSLILMDELGRGTSTTDGIAIAKSVLDYFHDQVKAKLICSTHYHELIDMEKPDNRMSNFHAEIIQEDEEMKLTYHIRPGGSGKSFGIEVAKKVGLPSEIIERANHYLQTGK